MKKSKLLFAASAALSLVTAGGAWAASEPSQVPLYSAVPGAKPNVMLVLDNSGSMDWESQENYNFPNNDCPVVGNNGQCQNKYGWYAKRSNAVNTQYYNPATTYLARVDAQGVPLVNPIKFVENQSTSNSSAKYPVKHNAYTSIPANQKFTYVQCASDDCSTSRTVVDIASSSLGGSITLPLGHNRSDCGASATTCTTAKELQNIVNWYYWYRSRSEAVSTAIGQALQGYENKIRVGYTQYNTGSSRSTAINSGVRYFKDVAGDPGKQWKTDLYTWLYALDPNGSTHSHRALALAADYYSGAGTVRATYGNPWKNDPTQTGAESKSQDLSCRRSFAIVLSDGAWNAGTSSGAASKWASINGTSNFSGNPGGNSAALQYDPNGANGWNSSLLAARLKARNLYIPYGDGGNSSLGFADYTASLYWNKDFSALDNNVRPLSGQHNPTFWQNLTTYTIGWGLTPTGELGVSGGLTWDQINKYNNDWLAGVMNPVRPKWADSYSSKNLNTNDTGNAVYDDALRVNDFIRAGYAGGGKAYSVYSGDDVRKAIDNVLSGIVGAGNDAGVAVSGNSSEFQTLENQYKFTTEYQTADNSGDVKAFRLNASGGYLELDPSGKPQFAWSAKALMPALADRKIFALSNYDPEVPASGNRLAMTSTTTLDSLPSDLKLLLQADNLQKSDASFVRYLLGEDPQQDKNGTVYRLRNSPIGASVNSPPVFVGGRIDMGYDLFGGVDGKTGYAAYRTKKQTLPPTIFAATNNGKVHVLNAAKDDATVTGVKAGEELAEFMPKGSMAAQVDLASATAKFRYTLDGPVAEHDVYDNSVNSPKWRQVVLGSGGRAAPFLYGLESPMNTGNRTPTKDNFLWEVNAQTAGYGDMASVTHLPTAGQLDDGTWVMLTGSGQYPGSGKKVGLYVVNALTGKLVKFIPLPTAWNSGNRGLGGVVAVRDTNRKVVAAFAGDANGNLWRFDLRSGSFAVSYGQPLFTTPGGKKQPIYATPTWQAHPGDGSTCKVGPTTQCGAMVVIGTGILLDEDDLAQPAAAQAIYGIWDKTPIGSSDAIGTGSVSTANLVEQTIDLVSAKDGAGQELGKKFYQVSTNKVDWESKRGWLVKLGVIPFSGAMPKGERVVGDLSNLGSSVIIASFLPEDKNLSIESCTATGSLPNIIYVVDALTGGNKRSFDVNSDGIFDSYSIVSIPDGGFTRGNVVTRNLVGLPNEGSPDLKPNTECTNESGFITGVGGTQKAGDACEGKSWRRSWRSVIGTPF